MIENSGVPAGTRSPSFTSTLLTRVGQCATIMSVGMNTTSVFSVSNGTVAEVAPAGSSTVPVSGSMSTPGCAVPVAWYWTVVSTSGGWSAMIWNSEPPPRLVVRSLRR